VYKSKLKKDGVFMSEQEIWEKVLEAAKLHIQKQA